MNQPVRRPGPPPAASNPARRTRNGSPGTRPPPKTGAGTDAPDPTTIPSTPLPPAEFKVVMDALRRERDMEIRMYPSPNPVLLAAATQLLRQQIGGWVSCELVEIEGTEPLRLTSDMARSIYVRFFDHGTAMWSRP